MRELRLLLLLVATLMAGLAGCGGDDERTRVYFIDGYKSELGMRGRLIGQERRLADAGLGRLAAEVLRGPAATERDERGLMTGFSPDVRVSTIALANGTATVRLASDTPPRDWPDQFYAAAQLVYTLTETTAVERLVLTVNGARCCVYDRRQKPWSQPLTRDLFATWQGAPID